MATATISTPNTRKSFRTVFMALLLAHERLPPAAGTIREVDSSVLIRLSLLQERARRVGRLEWARAFHMEARRLPRMAVGTLALASGTASAPGTTLLM